MTNQYIIDKIQKSFVCEVHKHDISTIISFDNDDDAFEASGIIDVAIINGEEFDYTIIYNEIELYHEN